MSYNSEVIRSMITPTVLAHRRSVTARDGVTNFCLSEEIKHRALQHKEQNEHKIVRKDA